ncbi:MAG: hypothetical protein ABI743_15090, partial [bacterium]
MVSCSGGHKTPTAPNTTAGGDPENFLDHPSILAAGDHVAVVGETILGGGTLAIDLSALTGTVEPLRSVQDSDDSYHLSVQNYLTSKNITIDRISDAGTTLVVSYSISHPFKAPADLNPPATAAKRADLGISGRAVFLMDVPTATGNTFFGSVVADTTTLSGMSGYLEPKGLLPQASSLTATAFPYNLVVDEKIGTDGNRVGISNGGAMTGNYRQSEGGWQATNIGATFDQWTGYDFLHQGQTAASSIAINKAAITGASTFRMDMVVVAKYTDPREGANSAEKRANRLPATPVDINKFVYRLPYAAQDVSKTTYRGETGGLIPTNTVSSSTVRFTVRDWDARATVTGRPNLGDDPDMTTIEPGAAGPPTVDVDVPGVTSGPVALSLNDDDSVIGGDVAVDSGIPNDELFYQGLVVNSAATGAQVASVVTGMERITDVSNATDRSAYEFSLAPDLSLLTSNKPELVTYQAFSVGVGVGSNAAPTATVELQNGPV